MTKKRWLVALAIVILAVAGVIGGTALYAKIENDRAPAALGLSSPSPDSVRLGVDDIAGDWTVADGSQAGYRVNEVLNGQDVTVVGRTTDVEGTVTVDGTELVAADVTVSMTTVATDNSSRDRQFLDILTTAEHPEATFSLTEPVDIAAVTDGVATVQATGDLTVAGVTQSVVVDLEAQTTADGVEVSGSIPVTFATYGIEAPNLGFVKVEDSGTIEMLLDLTR